MTILSYKSKRSLTNFREVFNCADLIEANKTFDSQHTADIHNYSLYVKQGEFGVVKQPTQLKYIGSGEATTCHIVILQDKQHVGVVHLDSPECVVTEMPRFIQKFEDVVDCYVVGGFLDDNEISVSISKELFKFFELSDKIFNICLWKSLEFNTRLGVNDLNFPICTDVAYDIHNSIVCKANFLTHGPYLALRSRIIPILEQYTNIYDTVSNAMTIPYAHFVREPSWKKLVTLTDSHILQHCSTSPHCEPASFCDDIRANFAFRGVQNSTDIYPEEGTSLKFVLSSCGEWTQER